jgi:hypothetical protein
MQIEVAASRAARGFFSWGLTAPPHVAMGNGSVDRDTAAVLVGAGDRLGPYRNPSGIFAEQGLKCRRLHYDPQMSK